MKLAFCLFKYYPFGGLERDFLRIAKACLARGHSVDVYVMKWEGLIPEGFNVKILPIHAFTNHQRCKKFVLLLQNHLQKNNYDAVIGFNRMPGLDIYFAADPCYQVSAQQKHGKWYRYTPRFQQYLAFEKAVFAPAARTKILLLTPAAKNDFIKYYQTPLERFYELPPGVADDRKIPIAAQQLRNEVRAEVSVSTNDHFILMVGSDFKRKGVDRALLALAALPKELRDKTKLFIVGKGNSKSMLQLAEQLAVEKQIYFLGGRHDVLRFLLAADLLLHPAYQETAGMVLLEGLVAGLPILVTDNCGYAYHVQRAQAGLLVSSPYQQTELNMKLHEMLTSNKKNEWKKNAHAYAEAVNLFGMTEKVVDIIEATVKMKATY